MRNVMMKWKQPPNRPGKVQLRAYEKTLTLTCKVDINNNKNITIFLYFVPLKAFLKTILILNSWQSQALIQLIANISYPTATAYRGHGLIRPCLSTDCRHIHF